MYKGKKILGMIPARGGSKGIPRKNIKLICGKPLIAWTIEETKKSIFIDRFILSSEDPEIIEVAKKYGCEVPFIRPAELSADNTHGVDPALHAINMLPGYDYLVLLQPTSPLRIACDIDDCIKKCLDSGATSCVSIARAEHSPYWMYNIEGNGLLTPLFEKESQISRRQDLPGAYIVNGAVYVTKCDWLIENKTIMNNETVGFIMPQERSVDIDTEVDLLVFEAILKKTGFNNLS